MPDESPSARRLSDPPGPRAQRPASVPGQKAARHKRWTRVTAWVTVAGLLAFGAFAALGVKAWFSKSSPGEMKVEDARLLLVGIAKDVEDFRQRRGHLPAKLSDLRGPDLPSHFDAMPWDTWAHPVEYRIVSEATGEIRLRSLGPDGIPDTADDVVWPAGKAWK